MPFQNQFPLHFPRRAKQENQNISLVAANVKQNKTRIAFYTMAAGQLNLKYQNEYSTPEYGLFSEIFNQFLKDSQQEQPERIVVAVPGPVIDNKCSTDNLPFDLDVNIIREKTGVREVFLINDLEATAYGLAGVEEEDFSIIHEVKTKNKGNVAILAPGRGLGEAGLFWDGACLRPFATEGGHSEFAPRADHELDLYQFLKAIYGIVSWESVLSNEGMFNLFRFIRDVRRQEVPMALTEKINNTPRRHEVIIEAGLSGENRACKLAIETFVELVAREASNLVLKLKATGGLIITGSLANQLEHLLRQPQFYETFTISDKMENVLNTTPIYLLKNKNTTLLGAAYYGAYAQ